MSEVLGRVVVRGSDVGVPHVLVTIYDVDPTATSPAGSQSLSIDEESGWRSIGSSTTDENGSFVVTYVWDTDGGHCRARPDLAVVVSVSLERCAPEQRQHAKLATVYRRNAVQTEGFPIQLNEDQLSRAGNRTTLRDGNKAELLDEEHRHRTRRAELHEENGRRFAASLGKRREAYRAAEPHLARFMAALSGVHSDDRDARYVQSATDVRAANEGAIRSGIEDRINRTTVSGVVVLSEEQAARFRDGNGEFQTSIAPSELHTYLRAKHLGNSPSLSVAAPWWSLCPERATDPCEEILKGGNPTSDMKGDEEEHMEELDDAIAAMPTDVPLLIGKLVKDTSPPESPSIFKVDKRATASQIRDDVTGFALHSGPADMPTFHDVHHLQIAFEHVWQELLDDDVKSKAHWLYTKLVELGLDPNEYLADQPENLWDWLHAAQEAESEEDAGDAADDSDPLPGGGLSWPVVSAFDITREQWKVLNSGKRSRLKELAGFLIQNITKDHFNPENTAWLQWKLERIRHVRRQGERIIRYADSLLETSPADTFAHYHEVLKSLLDRLKQPHRFSVYAANGQLRSVNFGLVVTYRQRWQPLSYQAGELVKTIPLAPKEVRRFAKKVTLKTSRAEKEVQSNLESRKREASETVRAETEIIRKALTKTNYQIGAKGGINVGFADASVKTAFSQDAQTDSHEVKKEFREAVFKAAEEYKSERTTEVNTLDASESTNDESGEISNPNDEIPVTYLFYELQRRYRVSEHIHRLTPVVLVAQEFPKPSDIDDGWIIAHDWILRRVILDDSFVPAMNYVASKIVGDKHALQEMYKNLQLHRRLTDELKDELISIRARVGQRYAALQAAVERRADAINEDENSGSIISMPVGALISGSSVSPEAERIREEAARDQYERLAKEEREMSAKLDREATALQTLTESYTKVLSEHLNRETQVARLRLHIKSNIMHYMQAIWAHEPPDQRFFRLHQVRVPKLTGKLTYKLATDPDAVPVPPSWTKPLTLTASCKLDLIWEFETLAEVADLDNLLGFRGNYMLFPLKKSNVLTDFMTVPYLDPIAGLRDPDPLGNWTISDLIKYVCCVRNRVSKAEFERMLPGLRAAYQQLVNASGADGEEIVVPTDSLYIEALPGTHPILEDFKLCHRVIDVKKVQAEVRGAELENVRIAARLLAGEREDPTIEKKVVVEGGQGVIVGSGDS